MMHATLVCVHVSIPGRQSARMCARQADTAASQTVAAKVSKDKALQEQQAAAQRARNEASAIQRSLDDTQATLAEAQATHRTSLASAHAGRKDLQVGS